MIIQTNSKNLKKEGKFDSYTLSAIRTYNTNEIDLPIDKIVLNTGNSPTYFNARYYNMGQEFVDVVASIKWICYTSDNKLVGLTLGNVPITIDNVGRATIKQTVNLGEVFLGMIEVGE